jgi:hypothetical protein
MSTATFVEFLRRLDGRKARALPAPRNIRAIGAARENGEAILVSFMGATPWPGPTLYCEPGGRYEWKWLAGLLPVVVVNGPTDTADALHEILEVTNTRCSSTCNRSRWRASCTDRR